MQFQTDPIKIKMDILDKVQELPGFGNFALQAHHESFLDLLSAKLAESELAREESYRNLNPETANLEGLEAFRALTSSDPITEKEDTEDYRTRILAVLASFGAKRTASFYKGLLFSLKSPGLGRPIRDCYSVNALEDEFLKESIKSEGKDFEEDDYIGKVHIYLPYYPNPFDLANLAPELGIKVEDPDAPFEITTDEHSSLVSGGGLFSDLFDKCKNSIESHLNSSENRPFGYEVVLKKPQISVPFTAIRIFIANSTSADEEESIKSWVTKKVARYFFDFSQKFHREFYPQDLKNYLFRNEKIKDIIIPGLEYEACVKLEAYEIYDFLYVLEPHPKEKNNYSIVCDLEPQFERICT